MYEGTPVARPGRVIGCLGTLVLWIVSVPVLLVVWWEAGTGGVLVAVGLLWVLRARRWAVWQ